MVRAGLLGRKVKKGLHGTRGYEAIQNCLKRELQLLSRGA
jgi:hypothetical protein